MKKVILLFLSSLLATAIFAEPNKIRSPQIKKSLAMSLEALRILDTDVCSVSSRKNYLEKLEKLVFDFHTYGDGYSADELNLLALLLMESVNRSNMLGIDMQANLGGNVFTAINDDTLAHDRVIPNAYASTNEDIYVNILNANQLTKSEYTLLFDTSSHYVLTRNIDKIIISEGVINALPHHIKADGFEINLTGNRIVKNEQYTISPLRHASARIKLLIDTPASLALGWPVIAKSDSSNAGQGRIDVINIVDTTTKIFSLPQQLTPSLTIQFLTDHSYGLFNANTHEMIEGPITYSSNGVNIFPTPLGFDPGFRVTISRIVQPNDEFTIAYNLLGCADNRNGLVTERLYKKLIEA